MGLDTVEVTLLILVLAPALVGQAVFNTLAPVRRMGGLAVAGGVTLAERQRRLGDTLELPVVGVGAATGAGHSRPGGGGRGPKLAIALLVTLAAVGAAVLAFVPLGDRNDQVSIVGDDIADAPPSPDSSNSSDDAGQNSPDIGSLPAEQSQTWVVTNVVDGLNMRATPGTSGDIVGAVANGTEVEGTGARAEVNGSEWKQIRHGGITAWVAGAFLAPADEAAPSNAETPADSASSSTAPVIDSSITCFAGRVEGVGLVVALSSAANPDRFTGASRWDDPQAGVAYSPFTGAADGQGAYEVTLIGAEGVPWVETWTIGSDTLASSAGWIAPQVACSSVAIEVDDIVTSFPSRF